MPLYENILRRMNLIKEHLEKGCFSALYEISRTLKNKFQIKDADRLHYHCVICKYMNLPTI